MNETTTSPMPLVVLTEGQAKQMFTDLLKTHLDPLVEQALKERQENQWPEAFGIDKAKSFLETLGYPIRLSTIYKLTHANEIPFRRIGKRLVFSKTDLTAWVEAKATLQSENAALVLAESARRKK